MVRFGLDMIRLVKHDLAGVVKTCYMVRLVMGMIRQGMKMV